MKYRPYGQTGFEVSLLGLGCMRLPQRLQDGQKVVDEEKAFELIRYAADHGVSYFDTAFSYHAQKSESILGEALAGGRRERVRIATKQPLYAMPTQADIRRNLENTLRKLRTDYLDVYLIHNIQDANWATIKDRRVFEEFAKFQTEGLIKHIGFSYHGHLPAFREILAAYPWDMCQVQQNMLDRDKEVTEEAITLATQKGVALVIMEPLRGGGLAYTPPAVKEIYDAFPSRRPPVEWAFRHLIDYPGVSCILSGMSSMEQLKQNIKIFSKPDVEPGCLTQPEKDLLWRVKEAYETIVSVPCTGCEYCLPCPQGVSIPTIFSAYNEAKMFGFLDQPQRRYMLCGRDGAKATDCVACGACMEKCPQGIDIIRQLQVAHELLKGWSE